MEQIINCKIHESVKIKTPVNLYDCEISKNVFIGPFVEIQNDVFIDENTRVQSHSFICSKVRIGKNCFIGHGVMFTNDKFHNNRLNKENLLSTIIGDNVLIGTNTTLLPVIICSNTTIGAGSVVTKNIEIPGVYIGNPARLISYE